LEQAAGAFILPKKYLFIFQKFRDKEMIVALNDRQKILIERLLNGHCKFLNRTSHHLPGS